MTLDIKAFIFIFQFQFLHLSQHAKEAKHKKTER